MQITKALATATNARLLLGINLEANNRRLAGTEARALADQIGRKSIAALEIGNEPELYGSFGWYHTKSGHEVLGRPRSYDPQAFTADFSAFAHSMPDVALAGPSTGSPAYLAYLGRFLTTEHRVGVATVHAYPLKRCKKTTHVTAAQLLSNASSTGLARGGPAGGDRAPAPRPAAHRRDQRDLVRWRARRQRHIRRGAVVAGCDVRACLGRGRRRQRPHPASLDQPDDHVPRR